MYFQPLDADNNLCVAINTSRAVLDFSSNKLQLPPHTLHSTSTLLLLSFAVYTLPSVRVYILSDCKKEPEQELPSLHTMVAADPWRPACCCFPETLGLVNSCPIHLLPSPTSAPHLWTRLPYSVSGPSDISAYQQMDQAKNIASLDTHRCLWLVLRGLLTTWNCFILRHTLFQSSES